MAATLVALVCLAASMSPASSAVLTTTLSYTGSYLISVRKQPWFVGSQPFVVSGGVRYGNNGTDFMPPGEFPKEDQPMPLKSALQDRDQDILGHFLRMRYVYFAGLTRVELEIRSYDDIVVFAQTFPQGLSNAKTPDGRASLTGFPAFDWDDMTEFVADGYLTFTGELRGDNSVSIGKWPPLYKKVPPVGLNASGPLCLFNTSSRDAVVISPLTQVMSVSPYHHQWKDKGDIVVTEAQSYWGLDREFLHVPAGFRVEVILVHSEDGIGKALEKWGQTLRRYYGTSNTSPQSSPFLDKFGYWTGPGSFYYNNTGKDTYEDVVRNVDHGSTTLGFIELDNWWYQSGSTPEAVVTWTANNLSLPHGLRFLEQNVKSRTFVLSCGWWSSNTTYAKQNNGSYAFIVEGGFALPVEKRFWVDLFHNVTNLNVSHVYMDAMTAQYNGITALRTQAGLADDWLKNLTSAAAETNVTLTFSGALPRMLLGAAQSTSVIQASVTAPYMDKTVTEQWKIGVTSVLAGALGLAAFKGAFWSYNTTGGDPYGRVEPFPALHMAIATFSMGTVASGDKTGNVGVGSSTRIVRGDRLVLRPSRMMTAIDAQFKHEAKRPRRKFGQIWTTVSTVPVLNENVTMRSSYTMGIVLAAEVPIAFNVTPSLLFPGVYSKQEPEDLYIWNNADPQHGGPVFQPFADHKPLTLPDNCWVNKTYTDCLYYVSPAVLQLPQEFGNTTVHLLGEGKFVPLSPQRVRYINLTNGVTLNLQGYPGEYVRVAYRVDDDMRSVGDKVSGDGTLVLELNLAATEVGTTEVANSTAAGFTSVTKYSKFGWEAAFIVVVVRCFENF